MLNVEKLSQSFVLSVAMTPLCGGFEQVANEVL